ncbi:RNA polymerase sporulation sigma factor SigF [Massilibacterium senegalense]|uniref:RNA polymerase sporulation sigma factor SigF n=1 Tax=Massilibacterium senegalense TaxID=1632858 RepID=UPI00078539EC|nr:RNA polymerase sporulation sigma factor SigF [Massilibacterium senegalense]
MEVELKRSVPLKDEEVKSLIKQAQEGNASARDQLIEHNLRLVWSVVQRFLNRGYEADDLFQIGCIGLVKAVDKFDLSYDVRFSTYAVPMIIGEIRRFIRDDGTIKVSRSLKELHHKIRQSKETLTKQLHRNPTIQEIADDLNISKEELVLAEEAGKTPTSIHETVFENDGDPIYLLDQLTEKSESMWFDKLALHQLLEELQERERLIVYLRYFKDQTQAEIAERLGISQVQVSRLEKKILRQLKDQMSK